MMHKGVYEGLFNIGSTVAEMQPNRSRLEFIVIAQEKKQWIATD